MTYILKDITKLLFYNEVKLMDFKTHMKIVEKLEKRIKFLESEEYGKPLYNMGFKAGIESCKNKKRDD